MIFIGFTDVNGNVIPVQGAGTVYNEEKNSLALGKDTSAIGYDQLVFGRNNVEDTNKVEIVGGSTKETVSSSVFLSNVKLGDDCRNLLDTNATDPIIYIGDNETSAIRYVNENHLIDYGSKINRTITALNAPDNASYFFIYLNMSGGSLLETAIVIDSEGRVFYPKNSSHDNLHYRVNQWQNINSENISDRQVVTDVNTNIRTLDWQGNQWNAGDITCDDGNGNTISMRDLLSRIAALEGSK